MFGANLVTSARFASSSGPGANGWLNITHNPEEPTKWLKDDEFRVNVLVRLGCPIAESPAPCVLCSGMASADIYGVHPMACRCGLHNTAHNALVHKISHYATGALMQPLCEQYCFGTMAHLRADILFRANIGSHQVAADVAIISPFATHNIVAAASAPGAAATAYEEVKTDKYADAAELVGLTFVPLVVDTLGSWGEAATPLLTRIAVAYGRRFDMSRSLATRVVRSGISLCLMADIAAILLACPRSQNVRREE